MPALGRPDFASFGATYFNEQVHNLIVAVFTPVDTAENIGSAHMQGVETELTLHPARWLDLHAPPGPTLDAHRRRHRRRCCCAGRRTPRRSTRRITPLPKLTIAPELLFTGAFQDFLINDNGFSTGDRGTSGQGLIANLTVTYG